MKKKILLIGLIGFISIIMYLFFIPKKITFIIGMEHLGDEIDMEVIVNNDSIFSDILIYEAYGYKVIEKQFRGCFYKIIVSSAQKKLIETKKLFLAFKKYVIIEYIPAESYSIDNILIFNDEESRFKITTRFTPFYYE